jgi:hypothetical protein
MGYFCTENITCWEGFIFSSKLAEAQNIYHGHLRFKGNDLVEPEELMVDPYHPELGFREPKPLVEEKPDESETQD